MVSQRANGYCVTQCYCFQVKQWNEEDEGRERVREHLKDKERGKDNKKYPFSYVFNCWR